MYKENDTAPEALNKDGFTPIEALEKARQSFFNRGSDLMVKVVTPSGEQERSEVPKNHFLARAYIETSGLIYEIIQRHKRYVLSGLNPQFSGFSDERVNELFKEFEHGFKYEKNL